MTPYVEARKDEFIPATLETVTYDGKDWGVPEQSDAAFLYYRTDQVKEVADDLAGRLRRTPRKNDGIVYQGAAYEGLTCDFLEIAFAAGGKVLSDDGKKAEFDSPENLKALQFMVDGIKDGAAPKAVTTYMEEESRRCVRGRQARPSCATGRTRTPLGKANKNAPDSSRSRRSRSSRAAARPASSAATTRSSPSTRRTRAAR